MFSPYDAKVILFVARAKIAKPADPVKAKPTDEAKLHKQDSVDANLDPRQSRNLRLPGKAQTLCR